MSPVGIVTDSTCDLTPDSLAAMDVVMVPLKVLFDTESYLDWVELQPAEFYTKLAAATTLPKTSQPSPADFLTAYRGLAESGCDSIVSIHISEKLSGTWQSATMAAQDSPVPVHVVDSKKVSQALALLVKAACDLRDQGLSAEEIAHSVRGLAEKTELFFVLDTLEYLVKGGRAGKATGLAASLLNIKPVLRVNEEGIIEPFKKVKGRKKAIAELAAHVAEEAASKGHLIVSLLHACSEEGIAQLRSEIEATGADVEIESVGYVGAVVGTYAGPDAIGCAYRPAS